jgi:hypothetical protein
MTRKLVFFVLGVLASLIVLPAINLHGIKTKEYWSDPSVLYVMDPVVWLASGMLYPLGISVAPKSVIVGRDQWLHLSDVHSDTLTNSITPASAEDHQTLEKMAATLARWNELLTARGVKLFRVLIGPNKSTIYPETLPDWAQPAPENGADLIFGSATSPFVIDARPALYAAKAGEGEPIYFPLDSHWNMLGARAAFLAFAENVAKEAPDLIWPSEAMLARAEDGKMPGADLKPFLKLAPRTSANDPRLAVEGWDLPIQITDAATGMVRFTGDNKRVTFSMTPEIIHSPKALNKRRVLWLRDSFGGAMSPMMGATFTDVMAVHWSTGLVPSEEFMRLVDTFKPDYVFVTVVERDARRDAFTTLPHLRPIYPVNAFTPLHESVPQFANDITQGSEPGELVVDGTDPFLVFSIPGGFPAAQARFLALAVSCKDGTSHVPIQLFWASDRFPDFNEAHSVGLTATAEPQVVDLGSLPALQEAGHLISLRIDLDARRNCSRFLVAFPAFGDVSLSEGAPRP